MKRPTLFDLVLLAELNLGMPPTTFFKLLQEPDDWSFVVKLHAVLECALNVLIEKQLKPRPDERITFYGKVQLALEHPLLAPDKLFREFFIAFNFLRNRMVHDARYITADLITVLEALPRTKREAILRSLRVPFLLPAMDGRLEQARKERPSEVWNDWVYKWPRTWLHSTAANALATLSLAYYARPGKDGNYYEEEFRPQLQDLLHDPAVVRLRREYRKTLRDLGTSADE